MGTTIIVQHTFPINLGSLIAKAEQVNILIPNEEQNPCTPKTNSLFQLFKQLFPPHEFQPLHISFLFVGFAYHGKDIVFRFIIKYSSLMDFAPLVGLIQHFGLC
jgi:hypothetical protein